MVRAAAYTQRPRVWELDPIDTYVREVGFARETVVGGGAQQEQNLNGFLARLGARFVVKEDGSLGRIEPPGWLTHADLKAAKQ